MKLPEPAPDWRKIIGQSPANILLHSRQSLKDLILKANEKYVYWDEFKYLSLPQDVSYEDAWTYLKLSRNANSRPTPITDVHNGKNFTYGVTDRILKELEFINRFAGGTIPFDQPAIHEREKERYILHSLIEEAISSSLLEGAATTREKARELLVSGKQPKNKAEQMIVNNYRTMMKIKSLIDEPLSPELIKQLHQMLTADTLDNPDKVGQFRTDTDTIHVVDGRDNTILYDPPAAEYVDPMITNLCASANQSDDIFLSPIIKAIALHFWLGYIHPFVDGNGRTARALFYWYILKHKYWFFEYVSISSIVLKAPMQYARAYLYSERDDNDLTYFINFHLRVIHTSIEELWNYVTKKQKEVAYLEKEVRHYNDINYRQKEIVSDALRHPNKHYTIQLIQNMFNVVYQTARTDMLQLEKKGLFKKHRIGKTFDFVFITDHIKNS